MDKNPAKNIILLIWNYPEYTFQTIKRMSNYFLLHSKEAPLNHFTQKYNVINNYSLMDALEKSKLPRKITIY